MKVNPSELEDWRENLDEYLVRGVPLKRRKHKDKVFCLECGVGKGLYHRLGCSKELGVCGQHEYVIVCDCPVRENEKV